MSWQYITKLNTLGTVQREEVLDLTTLTKTVNDYDNSLLILLFGIVGILVIAAFVWLWICNLGAVFCLQQQKERGEHIASFREDCRKLINCRFHVTLLTLPGLGVILVNVIPIILWSALRSPTMT